MNFRKMTPGQKNAEKLFLTIGIIIGSCFIFSITTLVLETFTA